MQIIKLLLISLLINVAQSSYSQVTKFKTTSLSMKTKNESTRKWSKWSEPKDTEVLISLDFDNGRVKIFSKVNQIYDIIKHYDKDTDADGDDIISFQCVDQDGSKCILRFMILNSQDRRKQLYIDYSDVMFVYNIYNLD